MRIFLFSLGLLSAALESHSMERKNPSLHDDFGQTLTHSREASITDLSNEVAIAIFGYLPVSDLKNTNLVSRWFSALSCDVLNRALNNSLSINMWKIQNRPQSFKDTPFILPPFVTELNLSGAGIKPRNYYLLSMLGRSNLLTLNLNLNDIDDQILQTLSKITTLRTVVLTRTKMTAQGIINLERAMPQLEIRCDTLSGLRSHPSRRILKRMASPPRHKKKVKIADSGSLASRRKSNSGDQMDVDELFESALLPSTQVDTLWG